MLLDYLNTKRNEIENGGSRNKTKDLLILYSGLTNTTLQKLSKDLDCGYGVIRVWRCEENTKKKIKEIQDTFIDEVVNRINKFDKDGFESLEKLNTEVKSRLIDKIIDIIRATDALKVKVWILALLKQYFGYCDCNILFDLLVKAININGIEKEGVDE